MYKTNDVSIKWDDIKRFFTDDIKIWQVFLVGVTTVILLVFLRRSGNTSGTPSILEALLRNVLEVFFPARPRTKAIFLGMPALILLVYNTHRCQLKKLVFPLIFIGSIALVNTVNTFSHMKAPVYLSLYRTLAEIMVSAIVGLAIITIQELILKLISRKKEKHNV